MPIPFLLQVRFGGTVDLEMPSPAVPALLRGLRQEQCFAESPIDGSLTIGLKYGSVHSQLCIQLTQHQESNYLCKIANKVFNALTLCRASINHGN